MIRLIAIMPAGIGLCLGVLAAAAFSGGVPALGWAALVCSLVEFGTAALLWRSFRRPREVQQRGAQALAGGGEGGRVHEAIIPPLPSIVERNGGLGFRSGASA